MINLRSTSSPTRYAQHCRRAPDGCTSDLFVLTAVRVVLSSGAKVVSVHDRCRHTPRFFSGLPHASLASRGAIPDARWQQISAHVTAGPPRSHHHSSANCCWLDWLVVSAEFMGVGRVFCVIRAGSFVRSLHACCCQIRRRLHEEAPAPSSIGFALDFISHHDR
eukprot:SAG31_NODE_5514_length_2485_cov_1.728835_4_plen_164_part_00